MSTPNQNRIVELVGHDAASKPVSTTLGDLGLDSLDILDVLILLEQEFSIEISDELWSVDTPLQTVIDDVERQIGGSK